MGEINPKIFKAYDIRGVYPEEINEEAAYSIGRAAVQYLDAKRVAVGRDIRESSSALFENLAKGITDQGADVYDLGLASTPMVYFASGKLGVDGAIALTASHNPAEYNGMKICRAEAVPVGENSGLFDVRDLAIAGKFPEASRKGEIINKEEIKKEYVEYFSGFAKLGGRKFKIVIDFANAMGILEKEIYGKFPENLEITPLYENFDGKFPNHEANPLKTETLAELQAKVVGTNADLGIAYDGDADRVGFVDETGQIVPMDLVTGLIAKIVLEKKPGAKIFYDLRSSKSVKEYIEENGGVALECPVGHANIKKIMRNKGGVFAGELSGHYYFQENFMAEASTLAALMLLGVMAETGGKMSDLVRGIKRYFHSGEINSEVADKDAVIAALKEKYSDGKISELDGVKIEYPDWWFNVRPSNTEPVLRLNLEADTEKLMEEKRDEVLGLIRG
ncbi:MAG: phosphomannomutase/phosphoglucomutase [Candidatus Moranbacteria bacterium]|nr:phosphomannomutase/phosphoglucomutase [Candidatus Moranbacteria bacterium]